MPQADYFTVPFPMGNVVVRILPGKVVEGVEFDLDGRYDDRRSASGLAADIVQYFRGARVSWQAELLLEGLTEFQRRVHERVARIPYGTTVSYGEISRDIGSGAGGRAVGQAMGANRFPLIVPCHRVVNADGSIGGFSSGIALKRYLLHLEGVRI